MTECVCVCDTFLPSETRHYFTDGNVANRTVINQMHDEQNNTENTQKRANARERDPALLRLKYSHSGAARVRGGRRTPNWATAQCGPGSRRRPSAHNQADPEKEALTAIIKNCSIVTRYNCYTILINQQLSSPLPTQMASAP